MKFRTGLGCVRLTSLGKSGCNSGTAGCKFSTAGCSHSTFGSSINTVSLQEELREKLLWQQANPEEFHAWQERRNKPWDDSDMPPDVSLQQTHRKKKRRKENKDFRK